MDTVYVVRGFNNDNYKGTFADVYHTEKKMIDRVHQYMAANMGISLEQFMDLLKNNREEFDDRFEDGSDRTYEQCFEDGGHYTPKGYEITWGEEFVE